jgi:hypothetical protein
MGEVADPRRTLTAPDDLVGTEPPSFGSFFEEERERLLRIRERTPPVEVLPDGETALRK